MNIAELFVNLGIKGADKTIGALGNVKKGMGELGSTSLEAKAAILGAMYGLERMMAISGQMGTNLTNFNALTGLSAQGLQKWQYAARQAGISSDEFTGSLKGVQNSMSNMLMGKGAPEGMALVSKAVGGLDPARYRDTFYMMTKLQEAMQKMSPEMAGIAGKSFGLSEGTIAAMRRNAFNPGAFAKAPTYSDREIGALDKANIAWSNLGNKIEMAFGHFNAKHGNELVGDITKILPSVIKLVDAFVKLGEAIKVFQLLGKVFDGWGLIFDKLTNIMNNINGTEKKGDKGESTWQTTKDFAKFLFTDPSEYGGKSLSDPIIGPEKGGGGNTTHSTNITQHITHYGDAKDTKAVKDTHKHAINQAYRQRSAQLQGS